MTKKMITEKHSIMYDLEGLTLLEAAAFLVELSKTHLNGTLIIDGEWDNVHLAATYQREETDEEYNKRLKMEENQRKANIKKKADVEKRERALLEKLQKKYETS